MLVVMAVCLLLMVMTLLQVSTQLMMEVVLSMVMMLIVQTLGDPDERLLAALMVMIMTMTTMMSIVISPDQDATHYQPPFPCYGFQASSSF